MIHIFDSRVLSYLASYVCRGEHYPPGPTSVVLLSPTEMVMLDVNAPAGSATDTLFTIAEPRKGVPSSIVIATPATTVVTLVFFSV